jgi:antitoxin (DNA-binding transcriptional repressor) of toxin-antitoxin stability system
VTTAYDKGSVAEAAIAFRAARLGVPVLRPGSGHARYDLALDIGGELLRVQCKWGRLDREDSVVCVKCSGSRHAPRGYIRTTYAEDEVDLFGIYCGELDRSFLLPIQLAAGKHQVQLRLTPSRNAQRAGVILAGDYEFDGAIAQLGERSAGSRKVAGSNPASSTPPGAGVVVGAHAFRERFGYWMELAASGRDVVITSRGKRRLRLIAIEPTGTPPRIQPIPTPEDAQLTAELAGSSASSS